MQIKYFDWAEHQAQMRPNKIAIKDYTLGEETSYSELNVNASKIANYLQSQNLKAGDRIALLAKNHRIFFELQFACAKVGVILVPLNWRLTPAELSFILGDCNPKLMIFDTFFKNVVNELSNLITDLNSIGFDPHQQVDELCQALDNCSSNFSRVDQNLDDLIMIMYTSGTTGHPKGAKINHKMQLFNAINLSGLGSITSKTTQIVVLPLFHTGGLNCYANPVLHQGGQLIIMRDFDPKITLEAINDKSLAISHLFAVPAPLQFMMQDPSFDKTDFSRLENVGVGGAPCAEIIIKKWQAKGIDVIQGWGMTETSPAGIFFSC
jgi:fatty-acyl-CoA synthase